MSKKLNAFLPIRSGSQRVPNKNTRMFAGIEGGLSKIKLQQLLSCEHIDGIYVSTNDPAIRKISNDLNSDRIRVIDRPQRLASQSSSTDQLIEYVPEIMPDGHILWTHVTSPLITAEQYDLMISAYFMGIDNYDSLMSVTKIRKFIWDSRGALNYNRALEKWPQTQSLPAVWEINSGAFIASKDTYLNKSDRIGDRPFLYELNSDIAIDIDWIGDFKIAEVFYKLSQGEL